jgi:hypothetical protein
MNNLDSFVNYIAYYYQPLIGLIAGVIVLGLVAYINWYGTVKVDVVQWIARHVFRNQYMSVKSADGLFMTVSAYLMLFAALAIILASGFLTYKG